ncbi:MAG TPA: energy-coupling factor transporter transmembrane component T [Clostridia bacterium]|jgi:energy-coupling factor transport system permease protein|nr:energy-coupling factor transporter transmembrane component T [Clostridia bacterium]
MTACNVKNPIYPLAGVAISVSTLFFGLLTAKLDGIYLFYIALFILYFVFGYWRACLAIIPMLIVMVGLFAGLTYLTGHNIENTLYAVNRSLAVTFAVVPGLAVPSTQFIRNLQQIKTPKVITLGMMIAVSFFPLFIKEMRQIREAMKTRGVTSALNPKVFYRAFLIPLIVRIVNISEILSISVETRGFTTDKSAVTVYNPIKFKFRDGLFITLFIIIAVLSALMFTVIFNGVL